MKNKQNHRKSIKLIRKIDEKQKKEIDKTHQKIDENKIKSKHHRKSIKLIKKIDENQKNI